jgi:NAD+ synthase
MSAALDAPPSRCVLLTPSVDATTIRPTSELDAGADVKELRMELADRIADWIAAHVRAAGLTGSVVGLSGGIDSAVVSGLCVRALGAEQVLGVIMPCHSGPRDAADAALAARTWGMTPETYDLSAIHDAYRQLLPPGSDLADANLKPRLRMITLYHRANTLGRLVVGTGNKSELLVGYYTKYGDGGVDLLPIAGLYKHQVRELARELGVPDELIQKPPSAGLWEGQTDEAEMGMSYAQLDTALDAIERDATESIEPHILERVQTMIRGSEHKRHLAPIFDLASSAG